jgi:hypothetical protein
MACAGKPILQHQAANALNSAFVGGHDRGALETAKTAYWSSFMGLAA